MKTFFIFSFVLAQFFTGSMMSIMRGRAGAGRGVASANFQIHHLIFVLMFFYVLSFIRTKDSRKSFGIVMPSFWLILFAIYTVIGFLAFSPVFGFQRLFLNALYLVSVIVLFFSIYRNEDLDAITDVIGAALLCALTIITIKNILEFQIFISYFAGGGLGHPNVTIFAGGGHLDEAGMLSLYSVFLMKKKYALPVYLITLLTSVLYTTRGAFIASALVLIWYLMFIKARTGRKNLTFFLLITVPFVVIVVYFMMTSAMSEALMRRFLKTGDESGSVARIHMWQNVPDVIVRYPFGVGCGNAMQAVELVSGDTFGFIAMHNVYLQVTLEQGIFVGLPFMLISALWIFRHEMRIRFQNPFGVFMLLYFVQAISQSKGVDSWMAVILGLYFISRKRNWYAATQ